MAENSLIARLSIRVIREIRGLYLFDRY